jgi:hypothetical protein
LKNKYGIGVKLANPLKTKAIAEARIETDILDARTLAHLLRPAVNASNMFIADIIINGEKFSLLLSRYDPDLTGEIEHYSCDYTA